MTEEIRRMLQRNGTALQWQQVNPVLGEGEIGYERDTRKGKIGDGWSAWNALPYSLQPLVEEIYTLADAAVDPVTKLVSIPLPVTGQDLMVDVKWRVAGVTHSAFSHNGGIGYFQFFPFGYARRVEIIPGAVAAPGVSIAKIDGTLRITCDTVAPPSILTVVEAVQDFVGAWPYMFADPGGGAPDWSTTPWNDATWGFAPDGNSALINDDPAQGVYTLMGYDAHGTDLGPDGVGPDLDWQAAYLDLLSDGSAVKRYHNRLRNNPPPHRLLNDPGVYNFSYLTDPINVSMYTLFQVRLKIACMVDVLMIRVDGMKEVDTIDGPLVPDNFEAWTVIIPRPETTLDLVIHPGKMSSFDVVHPDGTTGPHTLPPVEVSELTVVVRGRG